MNATRLDAFLFDLDGTLFDRDTSVRSLLKAQFCELAQQCVDVTEADFVEIVHALDDHGLRSKTEVYELAAMQLGFDVALAEPIESDFWNRYHSHSVAFPDAIAVLRALKHSGKRTGIVTNGRTTIQNATVDVLGFRQWVDAVVVSEAIGIRKPDPALFLHASSQLGVSPDACCYIGDNPSVDVVGARNAGMCAVWIRTPHFESGLHDAETIDTLSDLLRFVF